MTSWIRLSVCRASTCVDKDRHSCILTLWSFQNPNLLKQKQPEGIQWCHFCFLFVFMSYCFLFYDWLLTLFMQWLLEPQRKDASIKSEIINLNFSCCEMKLCSAQRNRLLWWGLSNEGRACCKVNAGCHAGHYVGCLVTELRRSSRSVSAPQNSVIQFNIESLKVRLQ